MRDEQDLDRMLSEALATYGDPGPDPSRERRILAFVQSRLAAEARPATKAAGNRRWLPWAMALPVTAGLLLLFLLPSKTFPPAPERTARMAMTPTPAIRAAATPRSQPARPARALRPSHPAKMQASAQNQVPRPKLDVFPTPQPLTAEERALAVVAADTPAPLRRALVEAQKQQDAPLTIAGIRISPLELPEQDQP
jgi:hypothetical protein